MNATSSTDDLATRLYDLAAIVARHADNRLDFELVEYFMDQHLMYLDDPFNRTRDVNLAIKIALAWHETRLRAEPQQDFSIGWDNTTATKPQYVANPGCHGELQPYEYCAYCGTYNPGSGVTV